MVDVGVYDVYEFFKKDERGIKEDVGWVFRVGYQVFKIIQEIIYELVRSEMGFIME